MNTVGTLTDAAVLEIVELQEKARTLSRGTPAHRAESATILSLINTIKTVTHCSSDESRKKYADALAKQTAQEVARPKTDEVAYQRAFNRYLLTGERNMGHEEHRTLMSGTERRTLEAGQESITYTGGPQGGFLIPVQYRDTVFTTMSQTDPVLSNSVTDFEMEDSGTLQPKTIQGYDLSTVTATLMSGEGVQLTPGSFPPISGGKVLRGNLIFRIAVQATLESEIDIPNVMTKISTCYGVAFGRSLGQYSVTGSGVNQPLGLLTSLPTPAYTTTSGVVTLNDILAIYFSVNRFYRAQPKCSWIMSDFSYERIRKSVDSVGAPLLKIIDERETLLGKPVYVSPSFGGGGSPATSGTVAFGDMSHWHLRCSRPSLQRAIQASVGGIETGSAQYVGRIRFDSAYVDESSGAFPPITTAQITY